MRRNNRFTAGNEVEILFNPFVKLTSGSIDPYVTDTVYESYIGYTNYTGDDSAVSEDDVFACKYFGGRVDGIIGTTPHIISVGVTYDTFSDKASTYMSNFKNIDAYIFKRKSGSSKSEYFYEYDGSGYEQESGGGEAGDNNRILNCRISETTLDVNNGKFGYKDFIYKHDWDDIITVSIPSDTPRWKLQQMVDSIAIAIKGCNVIYQAPIIGGEYDVEYDSEYTDGISSSGDYTSIDNYNYYIKNDGGSLSPVVRLVTLKDGRIKYNQRRNVFEIQFVMLG